MALLCVCWWLWKVRCATRESQSGTVIHQTVERRSTRKKLPVYTGKQLELEEWIFAMEEALAFVPRNELVSRLYPTPLPRPISIQYSVTWRPTSGLSPCDTTIHLFALGPISVFVSRYTWYECAAGREKQSQNLIEKTYS